MYYESGALLAEEPWRHGERHGVAKYFYVDGRPLMTGAYVDGARDGEWIVRRHDGALLARAIYNRGQPRGRWTQRQLAEALPLQFDWFRHIKRADVDWVFEDGALVRIEEHMVRPLADRRIVREFRGEEPHGRWEHRDEFGRLCFEAHWEQGRPVGRWACYDAMEECVLCAEYDAGELQAVNGKPVARRAPEWNCVVIPEDAQFRLKSAEENWLEILERSTHRTYYLSRETAEAAPRTDLTDIEWEGHLDDAFEVFLAAAGLRIFQFKGNEDWLAESEEAAREELARLQPHIGAAVLHARLKNKQMMVVDPDRLPPIALDGDSTSPADQPLAESVVAEPAIP